MMDIIVILFGTLVAGCCTRFIILGIMKFANIFYSDKTDSNSTSELIFRPPTPNDTDETGMKIANIMSLNLSLQSKYKSYKMKEKITSSLPNLICYHFSDLSHTCYLRFYPKESIKKSKLHAEMFTVKTYLCSMNSKYYKVETIEYDLDFNSNSCCIVSNNLVPVDKEVFTTVSDDTYQLMKSLKDNKFINTTTNVISKATNIVNEEKLIDENIVRSMDWRDFEIWVANVFNSNGYKAHTTKPTNDGGKDVIATKDGVKYYIECKRWDENATIGRELLQKLVGAAVGARVKQAIFIATCPFNKNARRYATELNKNGLISLQLWGMEELLSLANSRDAQGNNNYLFLSVQEETIEQNFFSTQDTYSDSIDDERYDYYDDDDDTDTEDDNEFDDLDLTVDEVKEILAEVSRDNFDDDDDQAQMAEGKQRCTILGGQFNELIEKRRTEVEEKVNCQPESPKSVVQSRSITNTVQMGLQGFEKMTLEEGDIITLLQKHNVNYNDKRPAGGNLWIIGGNELRPLVEKARKIGFHFKFSKGGGKATKGKDGWWAK